MTHSVPAVVCLSGGLDSTSLLLRLLCGKRKVYGVSFDYGQRHRIELDRLQVNLRYLAGRGFGIEFRLIDLSDLSGLLDSALTSADREIPTGHYESANMRHTVVPNRNAIFIAIAYGWALSLSSRLQQRVDVCLAVHAGDHTIYPDCRCDFYEAILAAFKIGNWDADRVCLYLPYLQLQKWQILADARESIEQLGLDFDEIFRNTLTSYDPDSRGRSTGLTGSDVERILAFHKLGLVDPVEYGVGWQEAVHQALRMEAQFLASGRDSVKTANR